MDKTSTVGHTTTNLELIAEFNELTVNNDFDYAPKAHPAHNVRKNGTAKYTDTNSNNLVGRLYETDSKALSDIIVS